MDIDEYPVFWFSLAATQAEYGRLLDTVKSKAIEVIESGLDHEIWQNDKRRARELEKLKKLLLSEPRKEKKLVKRKTATKSGDVFVFKIDSENYAFGRVLIEGYIAIYEFRSSSSKLPIDDIAGQKVAFIVGTTEDGFYNKKWKVIGNKALESFFLEPIYFFHQPFDSIWCSVFNIWENQDWEQHQKLTESECKRKDWGRFGIEQWGSYSSTHIVSRLNAKLEGEPYKEEGWEQLHFRKSR